MIIFRLLREEDLPLFATFTCTTPGLNFTRPVQRMLREAPDLANDPANGTLFVAVAIAMPERVLAGVILYGGNPAVPEDSIYVSALGVDPRYRRQGIATRLKQGAIADMFQRGYSGIVYSQVNARNTPMNKLNESRFNALVLKDPVLDQERLTLVDPFVEPSSTDGLTD